MLNRVGSAFCVSVVGHRIVYMMTIEDILFAGGVVHELRRDERPELPVLNLPRRRLLLGRLGLSLRRRQFLQKILDVLAAAAGFRSSRVVLIDASPRPFRSASNCRFMY